ALDRAGAPALAVLRGRHVRVVEPLRDCHVPGRRLGVFAEEAAEDVELVFRPFDEPGGAVDRAPLPRYLLHLRPVAVGDLPALELTGAGARAPLLVGALGEAQRLQEPVYGGVAQLVALRPEVVPAPPHAPAHPPLLRHRVAGNLVGQWLLEVAQE